MVYARVLSSNPVMLTRDGSSYAGGGDIVSRCDGDILLGHGDVLQLTSSVSLKFRAAELYAAMDGLDKIQWNEVQRFRKQLRVSRRRLGAGAYASVFVAVKQSNGRQLACKVVPLPYTQSAATAEVQQNPHLTPQQRREKLNIIEQRLIKNRQDLAREYNVLKDLNHPNIVTLEKVICATYNIYIFQELITGGDLLSYIDQKGALTEANAVVIVRQLLKAVEYLHNNGVVHRDIKPENVLMTSWRDGARVVLTDFGQARTLEDAKIAAKKSAVSRMQSVVGTAGYTAP